MPARSRQRKIQSTPLVRSTPRLAGTNPVTAFSFESPVVATEVSVNGNFTAGPNTPVKEEIPDERPLSVTSSPIDLDTQTVVDVPNGGATTAAVGTPHHTDMPECIEDKENKAPGNNLVDSDNDLFNIPSPVLSQTLKTNTLREAIQNTRETVTDDNTRGSPLVWLTTPLGQTSVPLLNCALDDLRLSRYCLWMGNSYRILTNCLWVNGERSSAATLQWKSDTQDELAQCGSDAMIGFLGMISTDGLTLSPDAGWQPSWGEEKLHKQKQSFRTVYPGASSNIPQTWWNTQLEGALRIVESGCGSKNDVPYEVTHCFVNRQGGYLRVRSPLFLVSRRMSANTIQDGDEDDTSSTASSEENVPKGCDFATWITSSRGVREAFDRVIVQGYRPQVLEAYTRYNKIIHPNNVTATLSGAIVLVYCTLERMRFSRDSGRSVEFQYYANLVKVQVLKLASPVKSVTATKRRFIHSYGPNDGFGPDGRSADGAISSKRLRLTLRTD